MSEKMYTRLFRLYPARFREEYEGEALQLVRDRLRDERGFFKRVRLWWDLLADVLTGLPQAYRNRYAAVEAASLSTNAEGIPSFKVLTEEPLGSGSILLGGTLSLAALVAFGFLLSRSMAHLPVLGSDGRMSPIEAVMERLDRATAPGTLGSEPDEDSKPTSVGDSEQPAGAVSVWKGALSDASGRPVGSAEIHLIGGHGELVARTSADGSFAFSEIPSGDYEVAVVVGGREVAYLKALHLSAISSPSRLTIASGGRLLVSRPGR
jgi:Carboxypeptidase regulatory-like domain